MANGLLNKGGLSCINCVSAEISTDVQLTPSTQDHLVICSSLKSGPTSLSAQILTGLSPLVPYSKQTGTHRSSLLGSPLKVLLDCLFELGFTSAKACKDSHVSPPPCAGICAPCSPSLYSVLLYSLLQELYVPRPSCAFHGLVHCYQSSDSAARRGGV